MVNLIKQDELCRVGFVTITGRPNVGKSTLLNAIIGEKISIISSKAQTTRSRLKGIYNDNDSQIIFLDTPGVQKPKNKLDTYMENELKLSIQGTDVIIVVVDDSKRIGEFDKQIFEKVKNSKIPRILVINKIDLLTNEEILNNIAMYGELDIFDEIVPVTAEKNKNIEELVETVKKYLPYSHKYYGNDIYSDQSNKILISEIIREKALMYLDQEVPHGVAVEVEKLSDNKFKDMIEISAVIYCEKQSHKKIIIGKDGKKLKGIGKAARVELENIFDCKVFLQTWVKVKENWRDNANYVRNFGYISQ